MDRNATLARSRTPLGRGYYRLCRKWNDRSPLRLARDDHRNSHTPETAIGVRLGGRSCRRLTPVATVSAHPAPERSPLPAIRQMPTCGLWGCSSSAPTGSDLILSMSRIAPSRRSIAWANADRFSVLDSSMSLLPFDWGSRTHRLLAWSEMFKLEHCRARRPIRAPLLTRDAEPANAGAGTASVKLPAYGLRSGLAVI